MPQKRRESFLMQKKNVIALGGWCLVIFGLVAGIAFNAVQYAHSALTEEEIYRRLTYALLCFLVCAFVFALELLFRFRFPLLLELLFPALAFFALAGGTVYGLYDLVPVWDKLSHALGGIVFTVAGVSFAHLLLRRQDAVCLLFAFLFSLGVAYLWEIAEFAFTQMFPSFLSASTLEDTVFDLIASLAGAAGSALFLLIALTRNPAIGKYFTISKTAKHEKRS